MKRSSGDAALDARGDDDAREARRDRAPDAKRQRHDDGRRQNQSQQLQPRPTSSNISSSSAGSGVRLLSDAKEEDPHRLAQRQKQIDYGKNTVGYDRYCAAVPRHQRRRGVHPMTPDKSLNVSKKAFDGLVRKWRQALHKFDPPELQAADAQAREQAAAAAAGAVGGDATPASAAAGRPPFDSAATSSHEDDVADLDPARASSAAAASAPPALSIYENFVEDDLDDDDDDLL